jgi:hypothetical protein
MRGFARSLLSLALLAGCALAAQTSHAAPPAPLPTARPPVTSNSTFTVSGPAVGGTRTIALPWMNNYANKGDWYVTPTDAHAAFLVGDALEMKQGSISIELNGTGKTFVITQDNNKDTGHKTDQWFSVNVGSAQKSTAFSPGAGDILTVTVTRIDNLNFEATFAGTLTQMGLMERNGQDAYRINVNGVISLHRPSAPTPINAGAWVNCDPIVHDWLNQAENRAASECETAYDLHVRTAINAAFAPMISVFQSQQWLVPSPPSLDVLDTAVPRGSEKDPFHGQGFTLQMNLDPGTPRYQQLKAAADAPDPAMARVMDLMKQGKYAEAQAAEKDLQPNTALADFRDNTQIGIRASINYASEGLLNFRGAISAIPLSGGGTVLFLPAAQPLSGGADGDATTRVLLGPWGAPLSAASGGGETRVSIKAPLKPSAPRLSTQTVVVMFRCSRPLAQQAIQFIDWSALRALLAGN